MTHFDEQVEDDSLVLYKTEQVAEMCQVTPYTVRLWLKEGTLPGVKLENQWRIRRSDLKKFLNERYAS